MPYTTTWDENGVNWRFYGVVTMQEVEKANHDFYTDPRSDSAKYQIFDATGIEEAIIADHDIHVIAAKDKGASLSIRGLKVALIVNNPTVRSLIEVYVELSSKLANNWTMKIFDTMKDAREWAEDLL